MIHLWLELNIISCSYAVINKFYLKFVNLQQPIIILCYISLRTSFGLTGGGTTGKLVSDDDNTSPRAIYRGSTTSYYKKNNPSLSVNKTKNTKIDSYFKITEEGEEVVVCIYDSIVVK